MSTRKRVVFTKKITLRNGKVLYAHEVGKKVFRFEVDDSKDRKTKSKKGK